jgi:type IV pilus assembly protein PilW
MKIKTHLNKGFTIVELMITLVLSLMITYAIAQVLISSNRTSVTSDGMSQSQETGRFVMSFLAKQIRQAGLDSITNKSTTTEAFMNCTEFPALDNDTDNNEDNVCITEGSGAGAGGETQATIKKPGITHGDRLSIAWVPPAGSLTDCSGSTGHRPIDAASTTPLTPYAEDNIILNTFWVAFDDISGMNSLMCQGFLFDGADVVGSSPAQAIANGVEAMQILYGQGTTARNNANDRNVNQYVPAPVDPAVVVAAREVRDWSQVYAVKISIMTRSITEVTNSDTLRSYVMADALPYLMTDAVSRQVFTTTFTINNVQ